VPIFQGFRGIFPGATQDSQLIMSVVSAEVIDDVTTLVEEVCGDFGQPGSGIMFTVPVDRVRGLAVSIA